MLPLILLKRKPEFAVAKLCSGLLVLLTLLQLSADADALIVFRFPRNLQSAWTIQHSSFKNPIVANLNAQNETAPPITLEDYITKAVSVQNCYRAKHQAAALVLDPTISQASQSWADHLAATNRLQHSGSSYGENIFGATPSIANGGVPIYYWYFESKNYDYSQNSYQEAAGHFTQLVWKSSQRVGFGFASNQNNVYVVANYDPPGNVQGQFLDNVSPPSDGNPDPNSCANLQAGEYIDDDHILTLSD